jgi:sugar transferase (PEP-CTERM/EpsH1 system associated)
VRLLVVYRGLPWPFSEGYHLRILHVFRRLAERHEVHLLALVHEEEQRAKLPELRGAGLFASIRLEEFPPRRLLPRLATNLGAPPAASFQREYTGFAARLGRVAAEMERELALDCAYVFDPWADLLWLEGAAVLPTLLDVCDCRSLFYERLLQTGDLGWGGRLRTHQLLRRFRGFERTCLRAYPVTTAVSPQDRDALLHLEPGARVEVVPNGVDLDMFAPDPGVEPREGELLLFGNMDFLPNIDAAVRFARHILPRVQRRFPAARFTVVGTDPVEEVRALAALPGVEVTGRVPELRPYLARASMLVAPMRLGAGIKNKVLEALAAERPVVTTPRAAEAVHPEAAALLQLAESDGDFAEAVCALLADPVRRADLGRAGREVMRRRHSWEAAAARYEELLQELAGGAA